MLAVVLGIVETVRTRSRWVVPFLLLVVAGNAILTTTIKQLADRVRPALNPVAATLGPVVPERPLVMVGGLLRRRGAAARPRPRPARRGSCWPASRPASPSRSRPRRVLLDVHWLSDVVAGLALGWAWFAACAIAFGGRLLRFGAEAEARGARGGGAGAVPRGSVAPRRAP